MRLPSVLTTLDLPLPELHAARLDGDLFGLDTGFAPVDEIETAQHRALVVHAGLPARVIAEQRSAAWIWGAGPAPARHEVCVAIGARARIADPRSTVVREVVITAEEIVELDGLAVTSPLRTVLDLARFSTHFGDSERRTISALMADHAFDLADCRSELDRRRNLPLKRLAHERLDALERGSALSRS